MRNTNGSSIAIATIAFSLTIIAGIFDSPAMGEPRDRRSVFPPGTLGDTYQRPSRPMPADEHPRVGMLDIELSERIQKRLSKNDDGIELRVAVQDIRSFFEELDGFQGAEGKWHFESKPLYPGIPHIYDVRFSLVKVTTEAETYDGREVTKRTESKVEELGVRRIRLIPGRIVDLSF